MDLSLWNAEWRDIVTRHYADVVETDMMQLNLDIQHSWALMALNLRALTVSGNENVALMTEKQRGLAVAAKVRPRQHEPSGN